MDKIHNHEVAGSIPAPATKAISRLRFSGLLIFFLGNILGTFTFSFTFLFGLQVGILMGDIGDNTNKFSTLIKIFSFGVIRITFGVSGFTPGITDQIKQINR